MEEGLEYKHTKRLIQAYCTKHSNISTPSLISACFFTVGIQAHPLILEIVRYTYKQINIYMYYNHY